MIEAFAALDVRAAEKPLLAGGVPLMDRAAFALATRTALLLRKRRGRVGGARVGLLVGSGNNGGDALFAGALLRRRGVEVTAFALGTRLHDDGRAALLRADGRLVDLSAASGGALRDRAREVSQCDVVLDALVGTGGSGGLREPAATFVAALLAAGVGGRQRSGSVPHGSGGSRRTGPPAVVAVDVPSGVGTDVGTVDGPVLRADVTVTFGVAKRCLLLAPAAALAGHVEVADIGLGHVHGTSWVVRRLEAADLAAIWPTPDGADQKYSRGVLGVVAGTAQFPGAAVLASSAAVRAGVGMVRYVGPDAVARAVLAARPEVVPAEGRVQAWAVGPGLPGASHRAADGSHDGPSEDLPHDVATQHRHVRAVLAGATRELGSRTGGGRVPVVVDAGALSLLPERVPPSVVLTPHAGELASLLRARGEGVDRSAVEGEPVRYASRAHELTGATVLLKGAVTVVVGPGVVWTQAEAPAWLATAGAGDVLTGVLGALLAARSEDALADDTLPARLGALAASVHGRAAHAANPGGPVSALAVADALPGVIAELLGR